MKAIEIMTKTDDQGHLKVECNLNERSQNVRVLILLEETGEEDGEERRWLKAVADNPAFNFLKDEEEDIYLLEDGQPVNEESIIVTTKCWHPG